MVVEGKRCVGRDVERHQPRRDQLLQFDSTQLTVRRVHYLRRVKSHIIEEDHTKRKFLRKLRVLICIEGAERVNVPRDSQIN